MLINCTELSKDNHIKLYMTIKNILTSMKITRSMTSDHSVVDEMIDILLLLILFISQN